MTTDTAENKMGWLDTLRAKAARVLAPPALANVRSTEGQGAPFTELILPGGVAISPFGARGYWPCWGDQNPFVVGGEDLDFSTSSLVMSPVRWFGRQLAAAPPRLERRAPGGEYEDVPDALFLDLLARPNKNFSGERMLAAFAYDWLCYGNVYWIKARDTGGVVRELWPVSASRVEPVSAPGDYITAYAYGEEGARKLYPASDVIHFRDGSDPRDPRLGCPALRAVRDDLLADRASSRFSATALESRGGFPFAVSPKEPSPLSKSATSERLKEQIVSAKQGPERFDPLVLNIPVDFHDFHYSPEELNASGVRQTAEARVCSVIGISPMVLDLQVGLEHSTYSNKESALRAAWTDLVVPTLNQIAGELREQLLVVDFYPGATDLWVAFDFSDVKALQEDETAVVKRATIAYDSGWMKRSEARAEKGLASDPEDETYKPVAPSPFGAPFDAGVEEAGGEKSGKGLDHKRLDVWHDPEIAEYFRKIAPEKYDGLITATETK